MDNEFEPNLTPQSVVNNEIISQSLVDATRDKLRVFLVAQARRELDRVIKLTSTLDKIQDMYQDKVLEYMTNHDDESAVMYLPQMMETINRCLSNSYDIINRVVGNDKIMNFQVIQNNITDSTIQIGSKGSSYTGSLADPVSREKIREAVREILKDLPEVDNSNDEEV